MDENTKVNTYSKTPESLYFHDLPTEVNAYLRGIVGPENVEVDFYEWQSTIEPWFGNMEVWVKETFTDTDRTASGFKDFPLSVQKHAKQTSAEINFLFPETRLTKAFLPLFLTAYCTKRKRPSQKNSTKESLDALFRRTSKVKKESIQYPKIENYIWLPKWGRAYSKIQSRDFRSENTSRSKRIYATSVLFLFFLIETHDNCNVTWSFHIFEGMTGLLHLLGEEAQYLLDKVSKKTVLDHDLMEEDPFRDDILQFAQSVITDYREAAWDKNEEGYLSVYFYKFLANIPYDIDSKSSKSPGYLSDPSYWLYRSRLLVF